MTLKFITDNIDDKIRKDENNVVFSFYEIRIKLDLSEQD